MSHRARSSGFVVALDPGTSTIKIVVGERTDAGSMAIVGIGTAETEGMRRGTVVHPDAVTGSIRRALAEAELTAGVRIGQVDLAVSGAHMRSLNSRGIVAVGAQSRPIDAGDVQRAIDSASAIAVPDDRRILACIPQDFVVDDQDGIVDPIGVSGSRLEVDLHIITGSAAALENLLGCVVASGLAVGEIVLGQAVMADAVVSRDEKTLGVAVVDAGGGTTSITIFDRGALCHTAVLPIGGAHLTEALAVGLRTPPADAERLKRRHARTLSLSIDADGIIEVPDIGGTTRHEVARQTVTDIVCTWSQAMLERAWHEVRHAGYAERLTTGVVLTGGTAELHGLADAAATMYGVPVRRGSPSAAGCVADLVNAPGFATAIGLVLRSAQPVPPVRSRPLARPRRWRGLFRALQHSTH